MPKFACKCGQVINLSNIPNNFEMLMISDKSIDEITPDSYSTQSNTSNFLDLLYDNSTSVIFCDNCERLHLEESEGVYASYIKELE